MSQNENLAALSAAGVSVWLDDLSRDRLQDTGVGPQRQVSRGEKKNPLPGGATLECRLPFL